jgi:hypothetical protein
MIYLFSGSDIEKVRSKAFAWVAAARAKEPNLAYVRLSREELTDAALEEAALSGGLFVKRLLILLDDPFLSRVASSEEAEGKEESASLIEDHLERLASSDNAIIILAPKLAAGKTKKIAAQAKHHYAYDKREIETARGFNAGLVNALSVCSREKLWLELQRAFREDDAPEMLHGLLHWKARDLMSKGSRVWSFDESRQLSLTLIELLQDSRRGGLDLTLALERFALSI